MTQTNFRMSASSIFGNLRGVCFRVQWSLLSPHPVQVSWLKCGLSDLSHFLFLSFQESTVFSLYISSLCVILSSLTRAIFDLPEPYEKSFWGQWKYAHSIQQTVWTRHILELTGNLPRKWWRICWGVFFGFFLSFFFLVFVFVCLFVVFILFPWGIWWFIAAETCLWLSLGSSMYPQPNWTSCSTLCKPECNPDFFLFWMYTQTMRLFWEHLPQASFQLSHFQKVTFVALEKLLNC